MRGAFAAAARERVVTGRAPLISLLRRQLLPQEKPCVSKNLPLGDRLPRYGGGGACARGGAVARRAGGREPRLCPKPSCLREALSPTACGRSPLPEGAKEFFDNLPFPFGGKPFLFQHSTLSGKFRQVYRYRRASSMVSNSPPSVSAGRAAMVDLSNGISFCLRHSSTCTAMFFA